MEASDLFTVQCLKCGREYTTAIFREWGTDRQPETVGYGPTPKCVNLVPLGKDSNQVCGGELVSIATGLIGRAG